MTTMTDGASSAAPPPPFSPPPPARQLRRSNTDRVAAGVAGGLGEYFGIDPVLFRVLFAVTSFFGGAGIIAYLIAWILIPDHDTEQAPMDRVSGFMRRHRIPFWLVATVVVIIGWATFFSWWAPAPAGVLVIAFVVLAIVLSRRQRPAAPTATSGPPPTGAFMTAPMAAAPLTAAAPATTTTSATAAAPEPPTPPGTLPYLPETRAWMHESRERRRRAAPIRWITLGVLVITLGALAIADAVGGIVLPVYFWVGGGIVLAGLAAGLIARRPSWGMTVLLVPAVIGLIVFGNTRASLHDGAGRTVVNPTSAAQLQSQYRLAFGQLTLDLRSIPTLASPRTVDITVAGGQVHLLLPTTLNASVHADVHLGDVRVDDVAGRRGDGPNDSGGINLGHDVAAPSTATGSALTITVHLAAGDVNVDHS